MLWRLTIISLLYSAATSYALAAPTEALLGDPVLKRGARAPTAAPAEARTRWSSSAFDVPLARYGTALRNLKPDARGATRGAQETSVYRGASRAVVLVLGEEGFGSGVLISTDGQIVTNLHVVGKEANVGVVFKPAEEGAEIGDADVRPAKVIKTDEIADLALIKVEAVPAGTTPLKIGALAEIEIGSDVHAIGHPTGETWTYTRGIVSQIRKNYPWQPKGDPEHRATVIQTQTPINPGNSGGPLLDDAMNVIGINSFISDGEGLNYAVSADDVKAFLERPDNRIAPKPPACEKEEVLQEEVSKDPKGKLYLIDDSCDGEGDYVLLEPARAKDPLVYMFDSNDDGEYDLLLLDDGRDGQLDLALSDTDYDGESDIRGFFKKGEDEPYRWEKIPPKPDKAAGRPKK